MTFACLLLPAWPTDAATSTELVIRALAQAPRVRTEPARRLLWADVRGLDGSTIAAELVGLAESLGLRPARAGVAGTPVAAETAARIGTNPVTQVALGSDRAFLDGLDIGVLHPEPPSSLYPLLAGVGIERCGDLALLDRESVEVRFGRAGVALWRLARADDDRTLFPPRPSDLPSAEVEWVDYELDRQEHLLFVVNSLLGSVTEQLARARQGAHAIDLTFALTNRAQITESIRVSHPTAERRTWLRVIRARLEQVTFDAPVTRIRLEVRRVAPLGDRQGDLFDIGFATARATEAALAHLLDLAPDALVVAERTQHPLPEARLLWTADPAGETASITPLVGGVAQQVEPELTMQLMADARVVDVWTTQRRDALVPHRYYDGTRTYPLTSALGPDRVSGGFGADRFDREYFQCLRDDGVLILLYHDRTSDDWHLAGWWD